MGDQHTWDDCWKELEPRLDRLLIWIEKVPLPEFHKCSLTAVAATYLFGAAIEQRQAMGDKRDGKAIARELFQVITDGMRDKET